MGFVVFVYTDSETSTWCIGVKQIRYFQTRNKSIEFALHYTQKNASLVKDLNMNKFSAIKGTELDEPMIDVDEYEDCDDYQDREFYGMTKSEIEKQIQQTEQFQKELGLTEELARKHGVDQGHRRIAVSYIPSEEEEEGKNE